MSNATRQTVDTPAGPLVAGADYTLDYRCDTPGPEVEAGTVDGWWTGEVDAWGKLTIATLDGGRDYVYLFPREIVGIE